MARRFHIDEPVLRRHGLKVTPHRLAIGSLLAGRSRHIEARSLFDDACAAGVKVSLATVYNTLRDFERVGLVRRIATPGDRVWFDTDTGDHRHFYIASEQRVLDFGERSQRSTAIPRPPEDYEITRVDMVVHLERRNRER